MTDAHTLFDMFGGIRSMARALDVSPSSVMGWKREGRIPSQQQPHVLDAAASLGLSITAENVVFPLGRLAVDLAADTIPVSCGQQDETKPGGAAE